MLLLDGDILEVVKTKYALTLKSFGDCFFFCSMLDIYYVCGLHAVDVVGNRYFQDK